MRIIKILIILYLFSMINISYAEVTCDADSSFKIDNRESFLDQTNPTYGDSIFTGLCSCVDFDENISLFGDTLEIIIRLIDNEPISAFYFDMQTDVSNLTLIEVVRLEKWNTLFTPFTGNYASGTILSNEVNNAFRVLGITTSINQNDGSGVEGDLFKIVLFAEDGALNLPNELNFWFSKAIVAGNLENNNHDLNLICNYPNYDNPTTLYLDKSPELQVIVDQQTYEDTPFLVEAIATSPIGSQITYNALSDTSAMPVYMDGNSVAIGLQGDWNGIGNVTVIATDENQMSDTTTFSVTVLPVNDSPADYELIYPTVLDTIHISSDTDETIPFLWQESFDPDSDVIYKLTITLDYFGTVYTNVYEDITDTTYAISAYEYAILMTNLNLPRWNMDYVIEASDEEFTIVSEAGEFVFENTSLSIDGEIIPEVFALHQNYPNPFNPITSLRYDLPEDGLVNITIYDMMGRIVKTLVNGSQAAGYKSVQWNATNDRNEPVSAGLYLYTIQVGEFRQTKKMVLLK